MSWMYSVVIWFRIVAGQSALYATEKALKSGLLRDYDVSTRPMKNDSETVDVAISFSLLHLMNVVIHSNVI